MNIYSIHTHNFDRRELVRCLVKDFKNMKMVVVYDKNLFKKDIEIFEDLDIKYYYLSSVFWDVQNFDEEYDICIALNVIKPIDRLKDLNIKNLLLLGHDFGVPRDLAKIFDTDIKNISSFEKNSSHKSKITGTTFDSKDEYLIRENSKFYKMNREQLISFIRRDIKLNSLLE